MKKRSRDMKTLRRICLWIVLVRVEGTGPLRRPRATKAPKIKTRAKTKAM